MRDHGNSPRWKLIYFVREGKRLIRKEKLAWDPHKAQIAADALYRKGIKAHVAARRGPWFPPKGTPEDIDQMWCPFCRRWRYFAVPRRGVFNSLHIRCCKWCGISEEDWYVRKFNGIWDRPRRKRKRRRRRERSSV